MIDETILDEMNLPLASSKEDLETISTNSFKPLFDVKKFEIRSDGFRDKGIDFHIELKRENVRKEMVYTNFRFVVQLKATESKEFNQDGTISLQLDTANINYLLNNPMPAFYVLFFKSTNTFYFEYLNDFAQKLNQKDSNWSSQPSHVLRFNKILDANGIDEMYQLTLNKGILQRKINEKVARQSSIVNTGDKILIDTDYNVTEDSEIRKLIEGVGLEIINEGKWKEVIFLHKKASGSIATSSKYNLVLGIANYYSGNLMEALTFFKSASKLKTELTENLINHLQFFETSVKYSIGLISESEYNKKMQELENTDNVGLYIKLEKAKTNYVESIKNNITGSYEGYAADVQRIIDDPKANESIRLNAKCELILFEGFKNNMDYIKGVSILNALEEEIGPSLTLRKDAVSRFIQANEVWYKNVQALKLEATNVKNYFAFFNAIVNEVKVSYEFEICTDFVSIVQDLPGVAKFEMPDKKPVFDRMLDKITHAYDYFSLIGHVENAIASLSTKYEILHYLKDFDSANKILDELENIIESYDLTEQRNKFEMLKNSGTTHEQFKLWMESIFGETDDLKNEFEKERAELIRMDKAERDIRDKPKGDNFPINLFPIGYFEFPRREKTKVYEILNINQEARKIFDNLFGRVIPVANIYYNPIIQEGFVDGKLAEKEVGGRKNIYRIRKAFYENKFYRLENIPGITL